MPHRRAPRPRATTRALGLALAFVGAQLGASCGSDPDPFEPVTDPCDVDCDDRNPCTINRCVDARCVAEPVAEGTSCSDGDACNGVEVCGSGVCQAGEPLIVNDGDVCTIDACDPASGEVTHSRSPGCFTWTRLPSEGAPSARALHTAVWTGSEMIVWGGRVDDDPPVTNSGAAYDPSTDSWRAISTVGAPSARSGHVAVWTGSKMIVWGGAGATGHLNTGGLYDPDTDSWEAMSTVGAPSGRSSFASAWSGQRLLVHGGNGSALLANGGLFDPTLGAWSTLPQLGLGPRYAHTASWVGNAFVVWGGNNLSDWLRDGAIHSEGSTTATASEGALTARQDHSSVWTGSQLIVWGGWNGGPYLNDGALFTPSAGPSGAWSPMSQLSAPSPRAQHVAVWLDEALFVWGGCGEDACFQMRGDGGIYRATAAGGEWYPVPVSPRISARRGAVGVWTGERVIVWGGRNGSALLGDGASAPIVLAE